MSDLMFKNETANVTRKASLQGELDVSSSSSGAPVSSEVEAAGKKFFFDQFITPYYLSFLGDVILDDYLLNPIMACSLMARANRDNDESGRELARQYYVEAITATNAALRHPQRAKEDNTVISVCLLSIFEVSLQTQTCIDLTNDSFSDFLGRTKASLSARGSSM